MLYTTTRNAAEPVTAQHPLTENRGPDGGLYRPFRDPEANWVGSSFYESMANALNGMFGTRLTPWDLEFTIGRRGVQCRALGQRILMAEAYHNPAWRFDALAEGVAALLEPGGKKCTNWTAIAVRIALWYGLIGQLHLKEGQRVDVCVMGGDFSGPVSAWYARKWGLPIGNIVVCCNENKNPWDLLVNGQMRTDSVALPTLVPEGDVSIPENLERLIWEVGGAGEVARYVDACRSGSSYYLEEKLRRGLHISVVSSGRITQIIPGTYGTHRYIHSPASALCYAALQDYQARTGIIRPSVILAEKSPRCDAKTVAKALGISESDLEAYI